MAGVFSVILLVWNDFYSVNMDADNTLLYPPHLWMESWTKFIFATDVSFTLQIVDPHNTPVFTWVLEIMHLFTGMTRNDYLIS